MTLILQHKTRKIIIKYHFYCSRTSTADALYIRQAISAIFGYLIKQLRSLVLMLIKLVFELIDM